MENTTSETLKPFEARAEAVLACVFGGLHNCPEIKKVPGEGGRWEVLCRSTLSTFDFDGMTRLVIAAHDNCVRASVMPGGPAAMKIMLHDRKGRTGNMCHRHPTLEQAIESIRWK